MASFIFGPGAFRFVLAYMVVVSHMSRFQIGLIGVMAFFALSGYWVTRVLDTQYSKTRGAILNFYLSRGLRIFLLYLMVFALTAILMTLAAMPIRSDVWLALPIFGVATHGRDIIGVTWSLDIELQFYLFLPLLVVLLRIPRTNMGWAALGLGMMLVWAAGVGLDILYNVNLFLIYLPIFLAGAAIYLFDLRATQRLARVSILIFLIAGGVGVMLPEVRPYMIFGTGASVADKYFALAWSITLLPFIAYNVRQPSSAMDRRLGNLSYSIYLVHFPAIILFNFYLGREMTAPEKSLFLLAILAISIVLYAVVDVRFEALRRAILRWVERQQLPAEELEGRTSLRVK